MKLRFGIDEEAYVRVRDLLDAAAGEPPVGKHLSYIYLDTPDDDLAARGAALRFRRSAAVGVPSPGQSWRRQMLWPKEGPRSMKGLGVPRLKQRVDASYSVRIERWTWRSRPWAEVSLDRIAISTGRLNEEAVEMRIRCRRKRRDAAMRMAVELGAAHLVFRRAWERGQALLRTERMPCSPV